MPDHSEEIFWKLDGTEDEKDKKSKRYNRIHDEVEQLFESDVSGKELWGEVFELFAKDELQEGRKEETKTQKLIRELIEDLYENADSIIGSGKDRPSKPDSISIGFENNRLVIKEVIEIKSSENAYKFAHDKEQPRRSLETIQKIVTIINKILSEKSDELNPNEKLTPEVSSLSSTQISERNKDLNNLRNRLKQIKENLKDNTPLQKIAYSENLKYKIIIPKGERLIDFDPNYLMDKYGLAVNVVLEHASLTKHDIYKIIEHHLEKKSK